VARKRKDPGMIEAAEELREMPFPTQGLDESRRFHTAHEKHTPAAQNVRGYQKSTDRMRGSSRPGLARYIDARVNGDRLIQDVNHLALAYFDPAAGIGQALLGRQTTAGTAAFTLLDTDGVVIASAGTAARRYEGCVWDVEGSAYVATQDIGGGQLLYVQKVTAAGVVTWTAQPLTFRDATDNRLLGMAVEGGVLYLFAQDTTAASAVNRLTLHRYDASDGLPYEGTALWKEYTDLTQVGTQARNSHHNLMAYGGGLLGLLCRTAGSSWGVRVVDPSDGSTLATVALTGSVRFLYGIAADNLGNFYCLGENDISEICYLAKAASSGSGSESYSKTTSLAGAMTGVAYDSKNNRLAVVGFDVLGSGSSFATVLVTAGTVVSASDVGGETDWYGVAYDGDGGWVLSRGTGTNDFSGVGEDQAEDWAVDNTALYERYAPAVNYRQGTGGDEPASRRRVRGVVVSGGTVKTFSEGAYETVTSGSNALSVAAQVIFSSQNGLDLYFADGVSEKYYDSTLRSVAAWTPTAGALPVDGVGNRPRLICTWRGRTVLSGLLRDPQNWFMSAVNDSLDWDYAPTTPVPTQAVAGNNSSAGQPGDLISCLLPYTDDVLLFGGDHTIWALTGDPLSGGQIDLVTNTIGMAWGRPFCMDPQGVIYFFGSRGGVYRMAPSSQPVRISQKINDRLRDVNVGSTLVRMAWDDFCQGLYLFLTPLDSEEETTNFFWDSRQDAWWPDVFANADHNPRAVHVYDGDAPDDRVMLLGSYDGYLRYFDPAEADDDGTPIASSVTLGPIVDTRLDEFLLKDLQTILGTESSPVSWSVHVGSTAEEALSSSAVESGVWYPGRNNQSPVRRAGHAVYVKLTATSAWSLEVIRARYATRGKVRGRGA
jgi:hypothetical protein